MTNDPERPYPERTGSETSAQLLQDFIPVREDEDGLDLVEKVFQYYALFCCDVYRAALAANLPVEDVQRMAAEGRWNDRLKTLVKLSESGRPGDVERATNRAINFVQAHKYRILLEKILRGLAAIQKQKLDSFCYEEYEVKGGGTKRKLLCRPFADMASALEKCHAMTYAALNDTVSERRERKEEPGSAHVDVHVQIANQLAKLRQEQGRAAGPSE